MCLAQGPQRSDAGEARTRGPSVSSQALYHWATALPQFTLTYKADLFISESFQDYSWIQDFEADFPPKVSLKILN